MVTKTVVVMAEYSCIVYLYASQAGRQQLPGPSTGLCSPAVHEEHSPRRTEQLECFSCVCS